MNTQTVKDATATAPIVSNGNGNHSAIDLIDSDIVIARAQAIIDDTSGKYLTDTQDALRYHFEHASDVSIILAITERAERGGDSPLDLGARANAIIFDTEGYDRETREAVQRALDAAIKGDSDLDELIDVLQTCEAKRKPRRRPFVEPEITQIAAPTMSDDEVSQLTGAIGKRIDQGLRSMADAIKNGKHPYDAFREVARVVMFDLPSSEIIPQKDPAVVEAEDAAELQQRADAIINDENQPEQTREAVKYAIKHGWKTEEIIGRAERGENLSWAKTEEIESHMADWRHEQYGDGFKAVALSQEDLRALTSTVINGSHDAAELMLLLADEIERRVGGDSPGLDVSDVCSAIQDTAVRYHCDFTDFTRAICDKRRKEFNGEGNADEGSADDASN